MGLEDERADLLGLEARERLGRAFEVLEGQGPLVGGRQLTRLLEVEVGLGGADQPQARRPHGQRLVLDHGAQPRRRPLRLHAPGAAQEDLEASLVGVLGVLRTQRVAARGGQQRGGVLGDGGEDQVVARARLGGRGGRDRSFHAGS